MKQNNLLTTMLLLFALIVGSMSAWAEDEVSYTLTPASGSNNNYASNCDIAISGITWNLTGNSTFQPWRIGGKSLSGVDRTLYSKTAIADNITKIEVTHGAASSITVNSWTLIVSKNSDFSSPVSTLTPTFAASSTTTINRPANADWSNCYYKFVYNVSVSGSSNKFIEFSEAKFYKAAAPTFTLIGESNNTEWGTVVVSGNKITASPKSGYRVSKTAPYTVTAGEDKVTNIAKDGNVFTVTATGDCTVRINFEEIPVRHVNWSVNGTVTTTNVAEDADIVFEDPTENIPGGYSFMGWSASEITIAQATAPEYVTSAKMSNNDITYYAVFAKSTTVEVWKKLTNSQITDAGVYALITPDGHAFNGEISSGHGQTTTSAFSFVDGYAASAPEGTMEITLEASDTEGFKMYNEEKGYLYAKEAKSGSLAWHNTESSYWYSTGTYWKYKSNDAFLQAYNNSTFRTYASSSSGNALVFAQKTTLVTFSDFCTSATTTATIAINAACTDGDGNYYGTFYTNRAYVMHDDLEGQVVKVDNSGKLTVQTKYAGGDVVPANTALLIYAIEANNYTVNYTNEDGADFSDENMLKGTLSADEYTEGDNCLFYRLTMHNGTTIGFWWGAADGAAFKPGANKAYLAVPNGQAQNARGYAFGEEATGIAEIETMKTVGNEKFYNLAGQRVAQPTKGLYIVNGKKYIVK